MLSASALFAQIEPRGEYQCYYCGADCDSTYRTKDYVKPTFTNRDIVKYPSSLYICRGCVLSLGDGWEDMTMIDGSVKAFTTPRGMAPRMYSWLITKTKRLAFTKAHIEVIRDLLLNPVNLPDPPFALVISDSGQKQLIFRAPVAYHKDFFPVMLEEMIIDVNADSFKNRLILASQISSKIGKPYLKNVPFNAFIAAQKEGVVRELELWETIMYEPLSQLAAWLAPPKEKKGA